MNKKMQEGLVSIIVPVYNVEKYIDRCINSLIKQTYQKIEILLIDDYSLDASLMICNQWADKDARIHVIHKVKNEGLGEARNTGIANAKGEYICFVDSDDFIEPETIEKAYGIIKKEKADILHYGVQLRNKNLECIDKVFTNKRRVYNSEEIRNKFIPGMVGPNPRTGESIGLWMSLCSVLISMELIQRCKWKCESERTIISEDMYSLLHLYNYVSKAIVLEETFYCYCENEVSLTHTYREDRFDRIKEFYNACLDLCIKHSYNQDIVDRIKYPFLNYTIAALKQLRHADIIKSKKKHLIKEIYNDELLNEILNQSKNYSFKWTQRILFFTIINKHYFIGNILLRLKK